MNAPEANLKSQLLAHVRVMLAIAGIWWLRTHHEGWLNTRLFENPLWQYFASALFILLAFWVAKLVDQIVGVQLRKWAARTETKFDDVLLSLIRGPIKVISFVIVLHIGLQLFNWPAWAEAWLSNGLKLIAAISVSYLCLKLVDVGVAYFWERAAATEGNAFDQSLIGVLRKTIKVVLLIIAALVTAQNLGFNVTALITSLSVGGLAIGLAAQDTLANLFGAVAVFIDKPFKVGDRVRLGEVDGVVEDVGLRSTRIRNLEGFLVTIPNKTMGNATIVNVTRRPSIQTVMNIGLTYDASVETVQQATAILEAVFRQHPATKDVWISFNKFEADSLNICVTHWSNAVAQKEYLTSLHQMNLEIKRRFDAAKIEFAFPTQTLHIKQAAGA